MYALLWLLLVVVYLHFIVTGLLSLMFGVWIARLFGLDWLFMMVVCGVDCCVCDLLLSFGLLCYCLSVLFLGCWVAYVVMVVCWFGGELFLIVILCLVVVRWVSWVFRLLWMWFVDLIVFGFRVGVFGCLGWVCLITDWFVLIFVFAVIEFVFSLDLCY